MHFCEFFLQFEIYRSIDLPRKIYLFICLLGLSTFGIITNFISTNSLCDPLCFECCSEWVVG